MTRRKEYILEDAKNVVRSILEATIEHNRWATLCRGHYHPEIAFDVIEENEVDMAIERLHDLFHSSPVKIRLVEASFDNIATITLDNKTGAIISADRNQRVHDFDSSYTEIMESAEKKLGKPIDGYKPFPEPFSNDEPKGPGD